MSFFESIQKNRFLPAKDDLPVSQGQQNKPSHLVGLRRRISSFSVKIQPLSSASTSWGAFRRSKSVPSISEFTGGPLRRWWDWSWGWFLSRKSTFTQDLEMNEKETSMLGSHSKGSIRHVFYKVRSEIRKIVRPTTLPTSNRPFRYDSFSYAQNFEDGKRGDE